MSQGSTRTAKARISEKGRAADRASDLLRHYKRLERRFDVKRNEDYAELVVANGNGADGVHRWFRLKEAFSRRLLPRVIKDTGLQGRSELRLLDPFAGSGTALVSAAELLQDGTLKQAHVLGYECNPFLHLVASSKVEALQHPSRTFLALAKKVAAAAARDKVSVPEVPQLAAFRNPEFFAAKDLSRLLQLREAIGLAAHDGADPLDVRLALVCLGAAVEPVSSLRRDGRALRFVPTKERATPIGEFLRRAEYIDDDMPSRPVKVQGRVILGDGRVLRPRAAVAESVDLVLFSPPYPNNIDYTEVYKLEAWLLGFITDAGGFAEQRLKTVYSHPSILRLGQPDRQSAAAEAAIEAVTRPLIGAIPGDRYSMGRQSMIVGYARDMLATLQASHRALRPAGQLVYVVGNSLHSAGESAFVIAADLIIADLATVAGFNVQRIEVARQLRRRRVSSQFLRESVVFLRRPESPQANAAAK